MLSEREKDRLAKQKYISGGHSMVELAFTSKKTRLTYLMAM